MEPLSRAIISASRVPHFAVTAFRNLPGNRQSGWGIASRQIQNFTGEGVGHGVALSGDVQSPQGALQTNLKLFGPTRQGSQHRIATRTEVRVRYDPGPGKTTLFQNSAVFKTALLQNSAVSKRRCFKTAPLQIPPSYKTALFQNTRAAIA